MVLSLITAMFYAKNIKQKEPCINEEVILPVPFIVTETMKKEPVKGGPHHIITIIDFLRQDRRTHRSRHVHHAHRL